MNKIIKYALLISLLFLFNNCFEYEETIVFKKGFTGIVNISYIVPINQKTKKSMIRFLPLSEIDIESRINQGIFSKNIKIKDYTLLFLEKSETETNSYFQSKAKVSYKIEFQDLSHLDGVLIGYLFVKRKGNSINVKREFKSVLKAIDQDTSTGEKKIRSETVRLLGNAYILFKVYYPPNSEVKSNRGDFSAGFLSYQFPLMETIEKPGNKTWDYTIYLY
jgi:hypothetical protein